MRKRVRSSACLAALALYAAAAAAVLPSQVDTFEDGSTNGWGSGAASPAPPVNVAGGGPAGAADHFLLVTASGAPGPGGKLVAIAGQQWTGNFLTAGVDALWMDLNNLGSTDLSLRLVLFGTAGGSAVSAEAVTLAAGSGWTAVRFGLDTSALTGSAAATLAGVADLRLFHGTTAAFPGAEIAAQLGVDNVSAVPEPAAAALLAAGLLCLAGWRRGRSR